MATSNSAQLKETLNIRNRLKAPGRRFVFSKYAKNTYDKEFKYMNHDTKLINFARDIVGATSDCYLLYAVAALGVTDLEGIRLFLGAMHRKNKELSIPDMRQVSSVRHRLHELCKNGMLFRVTYEVPKDSEVALTEDGDDGTDNVEQDVNKVTLYTATNSTIALINKKLDRKLVVDEWIQAKPLFDLMAWSSCAYVAGRIAQNKGYVDQVQGIYKTPAIGTVILPGILKMMAPNGEDINYIAMVPGYLHLDPSTTTEENFEKNCEYRMKWIKQFFYYQDSKHHYAKVVVVVEDNSDLVQIARKLHSFGILREDYDRIFFTGEGAVRSAKTAKLTHCFLRMEEDRSDEGFSFLPATPDFIL